MIGTPKRHIIFSCYDNNNYKIIHDKLYHAYQENKLLNGKSFEFRINYTDIKHDTVISEEEFDKIIEGLSLEWNIYCKKYVETNDYIFFVD
jgi:hypothetical protein